MCTPAGFRALTKKLRRGSKLDEDEEDEEEDEDEEEEVEDKDKEDWEEGKGKGGILLEERGPLEKKGKGARRSSKTGHWTDSTLSSGHGFWARTGSSNEGLV